MCNKNLLFAFLGGAIVGVGAALLFAPQKGEELRDRIKSMCCKRGICGDKTQVEVDRLVEEIAAEVKESAK